MNRIKVLPDNLANQIAAGEVVERPASVVKELVENAIDAGATRLQIDIELGGRRLIRVSDDGEGMGRDDAILAFERHATSKITSLDDLARIGTLGFRGEALASISSVSKVELTTKTAEGAVATQVVIEGGRLVDVRDGARDRGTTIVARELFYNTPARRKFMRSEATENFHLTSVVTHYALAHPELAFALTNNGRSVINVSPARDLRERAFQLFGGTLLESLLPVNGGREHVAQVSGFISAPRERRSTRDSQYFFVNKRFVRDKLIGRALAEGYRSILPHGVYPVAFLFLEIAVEEVDVNVHPAKTEIRFRRGEAVKDVIAEAVRGALSSAGVTGDRDAAVENFAGSAPVSRPPEAANREAEDAFHVPQLLAQAAAVSPQVSPAHLLDQAVGTIRVEERIERSIPAAAEPSELGPELPPLDSAARFAKPVDVVTLSSSGVRPLGQLHQSFIVAIDNEGLLLIDQHVAHERILFDMFRKREGDRSGDSQNLLLPETVDLTPAQSQAFEVIEPELEALGFGIVRLSGRTVALKSVPAEVPTKDVRNLFAEMLDAIDLDKRGNAPLALRDAVAASLACRAAIKINMELTPEKMQWLIDRLLLTSSPTTCPHGRPVILRLSRRDIERGFHRT